MDAWPRTVAIVGSGERDEVGSDTTTFPKSEHHSLIDRGMKRKVATIRVRRRKWPRMSGSHARDAPSVTDRGATAKDPSAG